MIKQSVIRLISSVVAFVLTVSLLFVPLPTDAAADEFRPFKTECSGITALNFSNAGEMLSCMEPVFTNGDYELYFDSSSLFLAIKSISTGKIFTSNPFNACSSAVYSGNNAKSLNSQLVITYSDVKTNNESTLWSYDDCVKLSQFSISKSDKCLKVQYRIGREADACLLPEVIRAASLNRIIEKLNSELAKSQLKFLYTEYPAGSKLPDGYEAVNSSEDVYILNSNLSDNEKNRIEAYIKETGYTTENQKAEYKALGFTSASATYPSFKITVEYRLLKSGLEATIPAELIDFDKDSYNLLNIEFLKYFGSELYTNGKSGFVLIPDSSGAITLFSPQQNVVSQIKSELYGTDWGITMPDTPSQSKAMNLPVFGISNTNNGFIGIVEDGAGLTSLNFDVSGGFGTFYTAGAIFTYVKQEKVSTEAKVYSAYSTYNTTKYDTNCYSGNYKITFFPITCDDVTYNNMADICRDYYFPDSAERTQKVPKLSIETFGAVNYPASFIGFPYTETAAVTTFKQDVTLLENLKKNGIDDICLTLSAWRDGGFDCTAANRFDPEKKLGGISGIESLYEYCSNNSIDIYANTDFAFVAKNRLSDGFNSGRDTIRLLTSKLGGQMSIRPDFNTYDTDSFKYATAPSLYSKYMNSFFKKASKHSISSFNLTSLADCLNSDYKKNRHTNREQSRQLLISILEKHSAESALSFSGANSYALKYASNITDLSTSGACLAGESYGIPFVQLVISGIIPYSSTVLNSENNLRIALLKCIASASSPKFMLGCDNIDKIKMSDFTQYNTINDDHWLKLCMDGYRYVAAAFEQVSGSILIKHSTLYPGISCLSYSNGAKLYVNTTENNYQADNITIPAYDYLVCNE